jgi:hypothetical protein
MILGPKTEFTALAISYESTAHVAAPDVFVSGMRNSSRLMMVINSDSSVSRNKSSFW